MSRLYVANCTRQPQLVYFRLDFNEAGVPAHNRFQPAKQMTIPPGRQVPLGGDLHVNQIEDIIDQLSRYGLVASAEVPRLRKAAPFVFNLDQPVSADVIRTVSDINLGILTRQGAQRRAKAAVAVNETVTNAVANEFAQRGIDAEPTDQIDVAFEQQEQSEAGEKLVAEGFRVRPEGTPGSTPAPTARKFNRRRKS